MTWASFLTIMQRQSDDGIVGLVAVRKAGGSLAEGEHEVPSYAHCDPCRLRSSASSSSPRAVAVRSKSVRGLVGNRNALRGMPSTVGWSSCSPQRSAVQRLFWPGYCRTLVAVLRAPVYEVRLSVAYRFPRQRRCVRTADEPFTPTGVGSFLKNEGELANEAKVDC